MDVGMEEYDYIEGDPENDLDIGTSANNEDVEKQNIDIDDFKEDIEQDDAKIEMMEENDFVKPSPVYVVYPDDDRDVISTTEASTTSETGTNQSTKLFDIEYDQFL